MKTILTATATLAVLVSAFFFWPTPEQPAPLFGAVGITDNFDCGASGGDLAGDACGSGWATNWANSSTAVFTTETAPSGMSGLAVRNNVTTNGDYSRTMTADDDGEVSFKMQSSVTNQNSFSGVIIRTGGTGVMYIQMATGGTWQMYNGSTYVDVESGVSYAANTTYTVTINWNDATQADKWRAKISGGSYTNTYSAWVAVNGTYSTIDRMDLADDSTLASTVWWDDIGIPVAPVTSYNEDDWFSTYFAD